MKIKVTREQFKLMIDNINIIKEKGLTIEINGTKIQKLVDENNKSFGDFYKVKIWLGVFPTDIIISASNSANAFVIAKKMFPNARVVSAKKN